MLLCKSLLNEPKLRQGCFLGGRKCRDCAHNTPRRNWSRSRKVSGLDRWQCPATLILIVDLELSLEAVTHAVINPYESLKLHSVRDGEGKGDGPCRKAKASRKEKECETGRWRRRQKEKVAQEGLSEGECSTDAVRCSCGYRWSSSSLSPYTGLCVVHHLVCCDTSELVISTYRIWQVLTQFAVDEHWQRWRFRAANDPAATVADSGGSSQKSVSRMVQLAIWSIL